MSRMIDLDDVRAAMKVVVDGKPATYRFPIPSEPIVYFREPDQMDEHNRPLPAGPRCLVALTLTELGFTADDLRAIPLQGSPWLVGYQGGWRDWDRLTAEAHEFLYAAQMQQDIGQPWRRCLEVAEKNAHLKARLG